MSAKSEGRNYKKVRQMQQLTKKKRLRPNNWLEPHREKKIQKCQASIPIEKQGADSSIFTTQDVPRDKYKGHTRSEEPGTALVAQ